MWKFALVLLSSVAVSATSNQTMVECERYHGLPTSETNSPSEVAEVKLDWWPRGDRCMLNISWAISIDASTKYLTATRLKIGNIDSYVCRYKPRIAEAELSGSKQWFHYVVPVICDESYVVLDNFPLPPYGSRFNAYKLDFDFTAQRLDTTTAPERSPSHTGESRRAHARQSGITLKTLTSAVLLPEPTPEDVPSVRTSSEPLRTEHVTLGVFGALAALLMLASLYTIYNCAARSLGSKGSAAAALFPVPVLIVYPAQDSAFQQAVLALAEFLQRHAGCSVVVDMWQRGKIAELGPLRWLLEQIEAADRVLIVLPQGHGANRSPSNQPFPQASIPAATYDLFPLVLNTVASTAKNFGELAKFWVVQLGTQQNQGPGSLALELRACRTFRLMKNLNKLCRSLHSEKQDEKKISALLFRPHVSYDEKSTAALREAVRRLTGHQRSVSMETEPLKPVFMSV